MPRPASFRVAGGVLCAGFEAQAQPEAGLTFAGYGLVDGERRWTTVLPAGTKLLGVEGDGRLLTGHPAGDSFTLGLLDPANGSLVPTATVPLDAPRLDGPFLAYDDDQLYVLTAVESARAPGGEALLLRAYER